MDSNEGSRVMVKLMCMHLLVATVPLFRSVDTLNFITVVVCIDMRVYVYGLCVHTPGYICTVAT